MQKNQQKIKQLNSLIKEIDTRLRNSNFLNVYRDKKLESLKFEILISIKILENPNFDVATYFENEFDFILDL